jgi:CDP-diacylglycerol--glycerol-3-phosphate 3-phosphatidyltransferase
MNMRFLKVIEDPLNKINDFKEKWLRIAVRHFPLWVTPNMLTEARNFLGVPLAALLWKEYYGFACIVYLLGCLLDLFDGPLARERNLVSELGKILDPLADKELFILPLIYFTLIREIVPIYLTGFLVLLETVLLMLRIVNHFLKIKRENSANVFSKIKMWVQSIGICLLMLFFSSNFIVYFVICLFWLASAFATVSILKHIFQKNISHA